MVVLCDGMVRSGSTWSFNVALRLLRSSNLEGKTFGLYSTNPAVIEAAVKPRRSHLVIKSHALEPFAQGLCETGAIKAIYTWRDPYDVIVSSLRMFGHSVEHWLGSLRIGLRICAFHQANQSACIVFYDRIVNDPVGAIEGIASHLEISITQEHIQEIAQDLSFERVRDFCQTVDRFAPPRLVRSDGYVFDRETLIHMNHVRNGGIGYGVNALGEKDLVAIDSVLNEKGFGFLCRSRSPVASGGEEGLAAAY